MLSSGSPAIHRKLTTSSTTQYTRIVWRVVDWGAPLAISLVSSAIHARRRPTQRQWLLTQSLSLLMLGMFLSALATLNFSLALLVGLAASPLAFAHGYRGSVTFVLLLSPMAVLNVVALLGWLPNPEVFLREVAFGWHVWGMYTPLVVWGVWWPAWVTSGLVMLGRSKAAEDTSG